MNVNKILATIVLAAGFVGSAYAFEAAASSPEVAMQQQITASGVVVDSQGQPVPGASVVVKGTTKGTMTDARGRFSIQTNPGATLEISCIGYKTQSLTALENLKVVLTDDAEFLDEVVVVGFGTQKKVNLTGAVTSVDVDKAFGSKPITDVSKGLQGVVPGLTITWTLPRQ